MSAGDDETLVSRGSWGAVRYAVRANGRMPAREFIQDLSEQDQRKLAALFQRIADHGRIHNREKFKKVEGDIFEFKSFQVRVGCFRLRSTWFLTHGFIKKSDRWPKAEIKRAVRIRSEHLEWQG